MVTRLLRQAVVARANGIIDRLFVLDEEVARADEMENVINFYMDDSGTRQCKFFSAEDPRAARQSVERVPPWQRMS